VLIAVPVLRLGRGATDRDRDQRGADATG
jgi:hypothetical protein